MFPIRSHDQTDYPIQLDSCPKRIISLVPSQTELLFDLGLDKEIVGITKFCVYPADKVKAKVCIGGTKNFRLDIIAQLQPDLIIGNKEENYQEGIAALRQQYPVWLSNIVTLEEALAMIRMVGELVKKSEEANQLANQIQYAFHQLESDRASIATPPKVAYLIWRKPYMVAANGTFIDTMLAYCGFENVFGAIARYPEVTAEQLRAANPDVILLSSEPYPFKQKHRAELNALCPDAKVILVDGEAFSWYGSRLKQSVPYFQELISQLNG